MSQREQSYHVYTLSGVCFFALVYFFIFNATMAFAATINPNLVLFVPLYNIKQTEGDFTGEAHIFSRGDTLSWDVQVKNVSSAVQIVSHTDSCDRKVTITAEGGSKILFSSPTTCSPHNTTFTIPINQSYGLGGGGSFKIPATFKNGNYTLMYSVKGIGTIEKKFQVGYIPPLVLPTSTGEKKMLVLLFQYANSPAKPFTEQQVHDRIFKGNFNNFYREQTYGKLSFSGDVYWVPVSDTLTIENHGATSLNHPDVLAFFESKNIDLSKYDLLAQIPNTDFTVPGLGGGSTGKFRPEINNRVYNLTTLSVSPGSLQSLRPLSFVLSPLDGTLIHEVGHTLYFPILLHPEIRDCGTEILGSACNDTEGHPFDVMGIRYASTHFNAFYKEQLGWIPPDRSVTVTKSGRYTINPLEVSAGIAYAKIKLSENLDPLYYLEWRKGIGYDSGLNNPYYAENQKGLLVHAPEWERDTNVEFGLRRDNFTSHLLDMSPSGDFGNSSLNIGAPHFVDEKNKVSVKVVSVDTNAITFDVTIGSTTTVNLPKREYRGYFGTSTTPFIVTKNSTNLEARTNCKLKADQNPTKNVWCTWNDVVIYGIKPIIAPAVDLRVQGFDALQTLDPIGKASVSWTTANVTGCALTYNRRKDAAGNYFSEVKQVGATGSENIPITLATPKGPLSSISLTCSAGAAKVTDTINIQMPAGTGAYIRYLGTAKKAEEITTKADAYSKCLRDAAGVSGAWCTWNGEVILGTKQVTTPPVTATSTTPASGGGIYKAYKGSASFYSTSTMNKSQALQNCKMHAEKNPSVNIWCTWNGAVIFGTKPAGVVLGASDVALIQLEETLWKLREFINSIAH